MSAPLLSIQDLTVETGGILALHDLSASLNGGEVLAVLGANGAGKSSLLRAIMGLETIARGCVVLDGEDLVSRKPRDRAALGIGFCPEGRRLFPGLTVDETLAVAFDGPGKARRARIEEMFGNFPALADKRRERAWSLSGGQQQMLAIARAIMNHPRLVLLDEPTLGLAPMIIDEVVEAIGRITVGGAGVLLAEQNAAHALRAADRALILVRGEVVHTGVADDLSVERAAGLMLAGRADSAR
jgi:branched-chain amino acid transport system ATP-binding protein